MIVCRGVGLKKESGKEDDEEEEEEEEDDKKSSLRKRLTRFYLNRDLVRVRVYVCIYA